MASRAFLGSGDLYIDRVDPATGLSLGLAGPFEVSKFEIRPNTELKEKVSKGKTTYGQVIESVAIQKPADLSITLSELNKDGVTLALLGTQSAFTQGSGTITAEAIIAKRDYWVPVSKVNLAVAGLSVTHTSGTPTYVLGTDYLVNYRLGLIKVLSTGAILEGATIKVTANYQSSAGTRIAGATQAQVRAKFILDGINYADSLPCICTVWEAVLAPESGFDFTPDDFGDIQLKGRLKTPTGKTEPFQVDLLTS